MIVEILGYFVFPLYVSISTRYRLRPASLFFSLSPFQADTPMTSSTSWSHTRFFPISFSFVVFCVLKIIGPTAVMRDAFSFSYSYGRLTPKSSAHFDLCSQQAYFQGWYKFAQWALNKMRGVCVSRSWKNNTPDYSIIVDITPYIEGRKLWYHFCAPLLKILW